MSKNSGYEQNIFLDDFVAYLTNPGVNKDPYLEIYIRDWFENYSKGISPELCAQSQRERWSIGSHGGIIRPLVLSLLSKNPYEALGVAIDHQELTHRSQNVSSALGTLVPLLANFLKGQEPFKLLNESAHDIPLIKNTWKRFVKTVF